MFPVFQKDLERVYQRKKQELREQSIKINMASHGAHDPFRRSDNLVGEMKKMVALTREVKQLERERGKFKRPPPKV